MIIRNVVAILCTIILIAGVFSGTACAVSVTQDFNFKFLNKAETKSVTTDNIDEEEVTTTADIYQTVRIITTQVKKTLPTIPNKTVSRATTIKTSSIVTPLTSIISTVKKTQTSGLKKTPTVKISATITKKSSPAVIEPSFGTIAREHLTTLSETIGSRVVGSDGEKKAAEYIKSAFEKSGYSVEVQPFSLTNEDDETINSQNVIAVKPGKSSDEIIIGAHYDSTGPGKGADDNAASVAILLELAQQLKNKETPYTIRFIAFGSEEENLDGSQYFVGSMDSSETKKTIGMINLDSLVAGDFLYLYGDKGVFVRDILVDTAKEDGVTIETKTARDLDDPDGTPCDCADYSSFQDAGIPFAFLEATDWNLGEKDGLTQFDTSFAQDGVSRHYKYDTIDYLNSIFPGRINDRLTILTKLLTHAMTKG